MTSAMVPVELPGLEDPDLPWAIVLPEQISPKQGDRALYDLYWCGDRTWAAMSPIHVPRTFESSDALHAALLAEYGSSNPAEIRRGTRITRIPVKDLPDVPADGVAPASTEEAPQ